MLHLCIRRVDLQAAEAKRHAATHREAFKRAVFNTQTVVALARREASGAFAVELVAIRIERAGLDGRVVIAYGLDEIGDIDDAQFHCEFFQRVRLGGRRRVVVGGVDVHLARLGIKNLKRHATGLREYGAAHARIGAAAQVFGFVDETVTVGVDHDRVRIHVARVGFFRGVRNRNGEFRQTHILRRGVAGGPTAVRHGADVKRHAQAVAGVKRHAAYVDGVPARP